MGGGRRNTLCPYLYLDLNSHLEPQRLNHTLYYRFDLLQAVGCFSPMPETPRGSRVQGRPSRHLKILKISPKP